MSSSDGHIAPPVNEFLVSAYDGIGLAVRDHGGEGPDVVFVHGVTRTLEDWSPIVQRLRGLRAVAMDLRFHGRSDVPEDASWNDFVRDIDAVVSGLGLSNPFVVGHSFGGVLAMGYAIANPDCPGVVNIDGFDFRQRELYDELEPSVVDAFLAKFRANVSVVPPSGGRRQVARRAAQVDAPGGRDVEDPDEVASATQQPGARPHRRWLGAASAQPEPLLGVHER